MSRKIQADMAKNELILQIPCTATKDCKNSRKAKCKIQVTQQNFDIMVKTCVYYNRKIRQTKDSNFSLHRYVYLLIIIDTYILIYISTLNFSTLIAEKSKCK